MDIQVCDFCYYVEQSSFEEPCNSCNVVDNCSDTCKFEASDFAIRAYKEHMKSLRDEYN